MKGITTNRTSKAFLYNATNNKHFGHSKRINSTAQLLYNNKTITGIENRYKSGINPFNQSPKDILADLVDTKEEIIEYNHNKNKINKLLNLESQIHTHTTVIHHGNHSFDPADSIANNSTNSSNLSNRSNTTESSKKSINRSLSHSMNIEYECEPIKFIQATPEDSAKLENFDKIWNAIVSMRKNFNAPVDSMGAHCLGDKNADVETQRFQYLIACLLSSQTKDNITSEAINNLRNSGLLTIEKILTASVEEIDKHIGKVGFHNTKAKNLKKICEILRDKFDKKIPDNFNDLTSLPGIGPKMAHLILQLGFGKVEGIAVDVHVNRIANRLGWVKSNSPEGTREQLEKIIPKKFWAQLNVLLVGFGQMICTKAGPGCSTCLANSYCPVGRAMTK